MAFQPADKLTNRTFVGLIVAQFLAGFNDQAIHASAMFFALHQGILTEAQAISLMPILFFAPWAIFCTIAGYLADRYSKTTALVTWKMSEIVIALIALGGFYLGTQYRMPLGAWLVLSTVFLMGTHAAFFAPAKYGAMPEILQPHVLSRGNGILESTTFLAAILGTVTGGLLSFQFRGQEHWIGIILLVLSIVGAVASFLIAHLPPANPLRVFPSNPFKPLIDNLKVLLGSKPLALSVLGIAFFIFMVAYMRQTMYMHGETRNPRWNEFQTSLVVATVALGVGLGAPFAGYLSGGKVELGMVPLGCIGMILATLISGIFIDSNWVLILALVTIGIFSGFYMVPLYTLLQHRAPKTSKGDLVATSNFINVLGAMAASVLFYFLVQAGRASGITPLVEQSDRIAVGVLQEDPVKDQHGHLVEVAVETDDGSEKTFRAKSRLKPIDFVDEVEFLWRLAEEDEDVIDFDDNLFEVFGTSLKKGDRVIVSKYTLRNVNHYFLRPADQPLKPVYDNEGLPRFLFIGAALMTLGILVLLCRKLPDFFLRTLFWWQSLGKFKLKAVGMQHLPTNGPVLLATNCDTLHAGLQLVSVTDRSTTVVLVEAPGGDDVSLLRNLAQRTSVVLINGQDASVWQDAEKRARATLDQGDMLALGVDGQDASTARESFLRELHRHSGAPLVPVFCGPLDEGAAVPRVRVVFGQAVSPEATLDDLRREIRLLAEWIKLHDDIAGVSDAH